MTNILLIIIALLQVCLIIVILNGTSVLKSIKAKDKPLSSDLTLIDDVMNYIASKGKEPTFGEDNYGIQYFSYINKETNEITNIMPIDDIEYKKNSIAWRKRRAALYKAIDEFLQEQEQN